MKKLQTSSELRKQYNPVEILDSIEKTYQKNIDKLRSSLAHPNSPLLKYSRSKQISLLESNSDYDNELVDDIALLLKDTVYFMTLKKKERTRVTQQMRTFYHNLLNNQLSRINFLLEDSEIGLLKIGKDPHSTHKGIKQVKEILQHVKKDLEIELEYFENVSRSGYLSGLQVSMGQFFKTLMILGMAQKDQITLAQRLFNDFQVDWEEGDRENIKVSLQEPALSHYEALQMDIQRTYSPSISKMLSDDLLSDISGHARAMRKKMRRF